MRLRVRSLALLSGLRIRCCRELWYRPQICGSDLVLLWLWRRLVAIAPIRPLAWEPPYATRVAQEIAKRLKKKKKKKRKHHTFSPQDLNPRHIKGTRAPWSVGLGLEAAPAWRLFPVSPSGITSTAAAEQSARSRPTNPDEETEAQRLRGGRQPAPNYTACGAEPELCGLLKKCPLGTRQLSS